MQTLDLEQTRLQRNAAHKAWRLANPERAKAIKAKCYMTNPNYKIANTAWRAENTGHSTAYILARRQTHPLFKLRGNLGGLIRISFKRKGWGKETKTQQLLGCSFEEFKQHLEKQFKEGMTWENQGAWHLDHIKPCATATTIEELIQLQHYTNFQPLWASENLSKGAKYEVQ